MKKIFFIATVLILSSYSFAISIGASPSIIDLGNVSIGDERIVEMTVFSDTDKDLVTGSMILQPPETYFDPNTPKNNFAFISDQASEEIISNWIEFIQPTITLIPGEVDKDLPGYVTSSKKMSFILRIPENADPGYHAARIGFDPVFSEDKQSTDAKFIAFTSVEIPVVFKVDGYAVRSGYITGFDVVGNRIDVNFYNNGTTTLNIKPGIVSVRNGGNIITGFTTTPKLVPPKKSATFSGFMQKPIPTGSYELYSELNWTTGSANRTANVRIEFEESLEEIQKSSSVPINLNITTIVIVVLVIIFAIAAGYYFIKRD